MTNFDKIDKLVKHLAQKIEQLEEYKITALSVEEDGVKVEVRKDNSVISSIAAPAVSLSKTASSSSAKPAQKEEEGLVAITSPMVGTYYSAASPESPIFVNVGDSVEVGKTVCIVEAMKLFNEIESEIKGKVVKILVENAQPVEYGQKLILIKPE